MKIQGKWKTYTRSQRHEQKSIDQNHRIKYEEYFIICTKVVDCVRRQKIDEKKVFHPFYFFDVYS